MTTDCELLRQYAEGHSEEAFTELVRRNLNLVYSAALRQLNGDADLARDVAQTVFADLARKAGALAARTDLTGWLYTSTRFAAMKMVRSERRRTAREQKVHSMLVQNSNPEPDWSQLGPVLDEVMHELNETDREAILLRYFQNQALADVGTTLGLRENAARMRVDRALEKLRVLLVKRGVTSTVGLTAAISAHAVEAAPAGMVSAIAASSIAATSTGALSLSNLIIMKIKTAVTVLAVAGCATVAVVQHRSLEQQRNENQVLRQQMAQLEGEVSRLSNAPPKETQSLAAVQLNELLRLRNEVGLLRNKSGGAAGRLQQQNRQLQSELGQAREEQKAEAARHLSINTLKHLGLAMHVYAQANNNRFATNFEMMTHELGGTNHGYALDNFEFVNAGFVDATMPDKIILRERSPRRSPDGTWERSYVMADGSVQNPTSTDGNFDDWEKNGIVSAPEQ